MRRNVVDVLRQTWKIITGQMTVPLWVASVGYMTIFITCLQWVIDAILWFQNVKMACSCVVVPR